MMYSIFGNPLTTQPTHPSRPADATARADKRDRRISVVRPACAVCLAFASIAVSSAAFAQMPSISEARSPQEARSLYDQRIAACDVGMPRPRYEACVRGAGIALDRTGLPPTGNTPVESTDGRAKIFVAPGAAAERATDPVPADDIVQTTRPSADGRATELVPSDSTLRGSETGR